MLYLGDALLDESIALSQLLDSSYPEIASATATPLPEDQLYSEHMAEILQSFVNMKSMIS